MKRVAIVILASFALSMLSGCVKCPEKTEKRTLESFGCEKK